MNAGGRGLTLLAGGWRCKRSMPDHRLKPCRIREREARAVCRTIKLGPHLPAGVKEGEGWAVGQNTQPDARLPPGVVEDKARSGSGRRQPFADLPVRGEKDEA
jgi:hypothetical protein